MGCGPMQLQLLGCCCTYLGEGRAKVGVPIFEELRGDMTARVGLHYCAHSKCVERGDDKSEMRTEYVYVI